MKRVMEKNRLKIRAILFACFLIPVNIGIYGQKTLPVYDGIDYSAGTLVYDNTNWWCLNASPENDVTVVSGSLSYDGLLESIANKLQISGGGDDFVIWFGDQPADTKVYFSFIFQVTDMTGIGPSAPAHFAGLTNSPTTSGSFGCSIFVQKDGTDPTKFNIGHAPRASLTPVWNNDAGTPIKYSLNTPILIVAMYDIIGTFVSGTPNDTSALWINPLSSTFEDTDPPAASLIGNLSGKPTNDINPVNRFYLRQDAASNTPTIQIDEIRIGSTWASVTPKSISTGTNNIYDDSPGVVIYPNPVIDVMKVNVKSSGISMMEIFDITGNKLLTKEVYQGTTIVDLSAYPRGMYLASFKGTGTAFIRKFIKK